MNSILKEIMTYTVLMDAVSDSSNKILHACSKNNIDAIVFESENRDRQTNILGHIQQSIDQKIMFYFKREKNIFLVELLKLWQLEINFWIKNINKVDKEILTKLDLFKDQTTQEISTVFKTKEQFKGYNLNNVRK